MWRRVNWWVCCRWGGRARRTQSSGSLSLRLWHHHHHRRGSQARLSQGWHWGHREGWPRPQAKKQKNTNSLWKKRKKNWVTWRKFNPNTQRWGLRQNIWRGRELQMNRKHGRPWMMRVSSVKFPEGWDSKSWLNEDVRLKQPLSFSVMRLVNKPNWPCSPKLVWLKSRWANRSSAKRSELSQRGLWGRADLTGGKNGCDSHPGTGPSSRGTDRCGTEGLSRAATAPI